MLDCSSSDLLLAHWGMCREPLVELIAHLITIHSGTLRFRWQPLGRYAYLLSRSHCLFHIASGSPGLLVIVFRECSLHVTRCRLTLSSIFHYRAAIDTTETGDFSSATLLAPYIYTHQFARFGEDGRKCLSCLDLVVVTGPYLHDGSKYCVQLCYFTCTC